MTTANARYIVDNRGKKRAVVLDVKEYSRLIARVEELEDALDLDLASRSATEFREYGEVREELVKEGRL